MQSTQIAGIDPGIVHTGVVTLAFLPDKKQVFVAHEVIDGPDAKAAAQAVDELSPQRGVPVHIFIEGYRSRSNLGHDKDMLNAVADFRRETKGTVLDNTGVKKIVLPSVLQVLGAWHFSTPTHHQDLRSAARIAVLGMMKDPDMNRLLADVIRDHIDGKPWTITN